jgi:pyruvate formate lyase activating enzyme
VTIRLPHIPHYNTQADVARSRQQLEAMGFKDFDCFDYITDR